jgi:molybdopterin-containing oxidoreductase family iron-sulfur binding subunit
MQNPNVTVRGIGVMEKCTFCVQRIQAAKFQAAAEGRALRDGDVVPACQQACPAGAIVLGDVAPALGPAATEVQRWRASPRAFQVLEELNVGPNVTYLARVRNPAVGPPVGTAEPEPGRG